ncbi:hypothetical protein DMENIID0001_125950 [Sergentomyia squamirostris]
MSPRSFWWRGGGSSVSLARPTTPSMFVLSPARASVCKRRVTPTCCFSPSNTTLRHSVGNLQRSEYVVWFRVSGPLDEPTSLL